MVVQMLPVIGKIAVTMEKGQRVYDYIHPLLNKGESVTVDFTGVEVYASSCLNAAFGQLYSDLSSDELRARLNVVGMPPYAVNMLKRVTANARRYYADPLYQKAVDSVLTDMAREA